MIHSIASSIPTFKTVRFHQGLNVLLADTAPGATEKQTRNSAGKTSVVEIVHFLLGADCDKESLFRTNALIEHSFQGTFDIDGERTEHDDVIWSGRCSCRLRRLRLQQAGEAWRQRERQRECAGYSVFHSSCVLVFRLGKLGAMRQRQLLPPVRAMPSTKCRCAAMKSATIGRITSVLAAMR